MSWWQYLCWAVAGVAWAIVIDFLLGLASEYLRGKKCGS